MSQVTSAQLNQLSGDVLFLKARGLMILASPARSGLCPTWGGTGKGGGGRSRQGTEGGKKEGSHPPMPATRHSVGTPQTCYPRVGMTGPRGKGADGTNKKSKKRHA